MPFSFIEHVTNYFSRSGLNQQKAPTLWPSSATGFKEEKLVGKCRRQAYFRYAKDNYYYSEKYKHLEPLIKHIEENERPVSNYTKWIWRQGQLYEDYCVDLAKEAGVFIAGQTNVYIPQANVSGKIDLVVISPETGKYHIVEVKSVYGFNANSVIGTDAKHKKGIVGEPRESHLMQLGIYQWWYANNDTRFGEGLLSYGARDTGRYSEYQVTVEKAKDGLEYIFYKAISPVVCEKVNSGISIQSIMQNYLDTIEILSTTNVPAADYELLYSQDRITEMYEAGKLGKVDTAQYEKRKQQQEEGKTRLVKPVEKGDWQCNLCEYKDICYDNERNQKDLKGLFS